MRTYDVFVIQYTAVMWLTKAQHSELADKWAFSLLFKNSDCRSHIGIHVYEG